MAMANLGLVLAAILAIMVLPTIGTPFYPHPIASSSSHQQIDHPPQSLPSSSRRLGNDTMTVTMASILILLGSTLAFLRIRMNSKRSPKRSRKRRASLIAGGSLELNRPQRRR